MMLVGDGLVQRSETRMSSSAPSASVSLTITTHANQTQSSAEWHAQLQAAHAAVR